MIVPNTGSFPNFHSLISHLKTKKKKDAVVENQEGDGLSTQISQIARREIRK